MNNLNLLPPKNRNKIKLKRLQGFFIKSYILIYVFMSVVGFGLWLAKDRLDETLTTIKEQKEVELNNIEDPRVKELRQQIESLNENLSFYKPLIDNDNHFTPTLMEIWKIMPTSIQIKHLSLVTKDKELTLEGQAGSREELLNFTKVLKATDYVSNIEEPLSNLEKKEEGSFLVKLNLK